MSIDWEAYRLSAAPTPPALIVDADDPNASRINSTLCDGATRAYLVTPTADNGDEKGALRPLIITPGTTGPREMRAPLLDSMVRAVIFGDAMAASEYFPPFTRTCLALYARKLLAC